MDKIKTLLEKSGCNPELTDKIVESLSKYKETVRNEFQRDYDAKIAEAKKVCLEETESHKRELARRLQIFCESKSAAIDAELARKSAINESETETRLTKIKQALEGVSSGPVINGDIKTKLQQAKRQIKLANESKEQAIAKANRQIAVANKVLQRNKTLMKENSELKKNAKVLAESRTSKRPTRLDSGRRTNKPSTARPTIVENQQRSRPKAPRPDSIEGIAANMEDL